MGYFGNGFVFTSGPDFAAIGAALPDLCICGRKHNQQPVWLVDLWRERGKQHEHCPFCSPATEGLRARSPAVDAATATFVENFERLSSSLGGPTAKSDAASLRLTLLVASAAGCPAFYFAADDEATDLGCNAAPGSLTSFGCQSGVLSIEYQQGQATVTPLRFLEDEDDDLLDEVVAKTARLQGFALARTREIDGGRALYENPVRQWPKEAGDPQAILGLGTWDPLANVDADFEIVYQRAAESG